MAPIVAHGPVLPVGRWADVIGEVPPPADGLGERYRLLLEHHPHAVVVIDAGQVVLEANAAAAALVGQPLPELPGRRLTELVEIADPVAAEAAVGAALRGETSHVTLTVGLDDRTTLLRATLRPLSSRGPASAVLVVAERVGLDRDVSPEVLAARAAAVESSEARATFIARTNHEIRTPLTSILAVTELLDGASDADERRELAATLTRAGRRLLRLIDNLLDFGAGEHAADERAQEEFDLHALLRDVVLLVSPPARRKGLTVTLGIDADVPRRVRDHPTWTAQILGNLLSNAVAFTERGSVELTATMADASGSGPRVMYRVSDTGIGITPEQATRLFEPFERPPRDESHPSTGVGLGLSIVKQLAALSGGTVAFASTPGGGSTFTVAMPVRPVSDALGSQPDGATAEAAGAAEREA